MRSGRREAKPALTGPDYLIGAARLAADEGHPYADRFLDMLVSIYAGMSGPDGLAVLPTEMVARRALKPHEVAPVAIMEMAAQRAGQAGDGESLVEIIRVGAAMIAKWPEFLLMQVDGHPTLDWKADL